MTKIAIYKNFGKQLYFQTIFYVNILVFGLFQPFSMVKMHPQRIKFAEYLFQPETLINLQL